MPIVHVCGSSEPAEEETEALGTVANAVTDATGDELGDVWCTFTELDAQTIGERAVGHELGAIVYVDLLMRDREPESIEAALTAAAEAVASSWKIPVEDVWARYALVGSGEIFAGGKLLK